MALKPCRECGKNVSEHAQACPNCGIKAPIEVSPAERRNTKPSKWGKFTFGAFVIAVALYFNSQNKNTADAPKTSQPTSQSAPSPLPSPQAAPSIIGQKIFVKDIFDAKLGCPHISDLISFYGTESDDASSDNSNGKWLDALAAAFRNGCINFSPGDAGLVIEQFPIAIPQNGNPILVNVDLVRMDGVDLSLFMLDYLVAPIKP